MPQYSADQLLRNLEQSGLWTDAKRKVEPDETPVNTDRTDPLTPVDTAIPPPVLPRTTTSQSMTPRRDS